jgi:hypothetical protein
MTEERVRELVARCDEAFRRRNVEDMLPLFRKRCNLGLPGRDVRGDWRPETGFDLGREDLADGKVRKVRDREPL